LGLPAVIAGIPILEFYFHSILLLKDMSRFISRIKSIIGYNKPEIRKPKRRKNKTYSMNKRGQYWFISYYQ